MPLKALGLTWGSEAGQSRTRSEWAASSCSMSVVNTGEPFALMRKSSSVGCTKAASELSRSDTNKQGVKPNVTASAQYLQDQEVVRGCISQSLTCSHPLEA